MIEQAIILAGGMGTRLRELTDVVPKPMVKIGEQPVLWHLMKNLSASGINKFIIATGYKEQLIKDYFVNFFNYNCDINLDLSKPNNEMRYYSSGGYDSWNVTICSTGEQTLTGGRVKIAAKYLDPKKPFLVTYGDGLSDINIKKLNDFHTEKKLFATVSTVQPFSRFGVLNIEHGGIVESFKEKPLLDGWVNIGFFIFEPQVLDFIKISDSLENEPLEKLARTRNLAAFKHEGFWQPMDTLRELNYLNTLWDSGNSPWKNWS